MAKELSSLHDKTEAGLDYLEQCCHGKIRVRNGSKNKIESIKKVRKRKFNPTAFAREIGQSSTSEVIN
jgi:hypothetical protein